MRDFDPTLVLDAGSLSKSGFMGRRVPVLRDPVTSAVASVAGGLIGAKGARDAAKTQADSAAYAAELQKQMYDQTRADQQVYRGAGNTALNKLGFLLGLDANGFNTSAPVKPKKGEKDYEKRLATYDKRLAEYKAREAALRENPYFGSLNQRFSMDKFQKDPGYQFRMDEGIKGLDRSAASRGNLLSGAALKGINRFSQDYASNEYGNAYNRFNQEQANRFNRLASLSGIGQTATQQVNQAGQNYSTNAGNAAMQGANATAAGQIGVSNAITGAIGNVQQYNQLNSLLNQGSSNSLTTPTSFAQWGGGTNDYQGYY